MPKNKFATVFPSISNGGHAAAEAWFNPLKIDENKIRTAIKEVCLRMFNITLKWLLLFGVERLQRLLLKATIKVMNVYLILKVSAFQYLDLDIRYGLKMEHHPVVQLKDFVQSSSCSRFGQPLA